MKIKNTLLMITASTSMFLTTQSLANGYNFIFDTSTDQPVQSMLDGSQVDGTSRVSRHRNNVNFEFNTRGLTPNNAYTLWIMHFDRPRQCFDSCACTFDDFGNDNITGGAIGAMAGRVADAYGQVALSNTVDYGVVPDGPGQVLIPEGIDSARSHFILVLRDHGPASSNPEILEEQLTDWAGGCTEDNPCNDVVISDHPSPYCRAWF